MMIHLTENIVVFEHDGCWDSIHCLSGAEDVTRIELPENVWFHNGPLFYHCFPNLQEIVAHPNSKRYVTYDGCLYSKTGELVFIPRGKTSVELSPFFTFFNPVTFLSHPKLSELSICDNFRYTIYDNCLYSSGGMLLYIPRDKKVLSLPSFAVSISRHVDMSRITSVDTNGNSRFVYIGGRLTDRERTTLIYTSNPILRIPASVSEIADRVLNGNYTKVDVEAGNPVYFSSPYALFEKHDNGFSVIYICDNVTELSLPDFTVNISRYIPSSVERLSFSYRDRDAVFPAVGARRDLHFCVRMEDGNEWCIPPSCLTLRQALRILSEQSVEVKEGTEYFYLNLYFQNWIKTEKQKQCFRKSLMQILKAVVYYDDLRELNFILNTYSLVNRKNIGRLLRYARSVRSDGAAYILEEFLPEAREVKS